MDGIRKQVGTKYAKLKEYGYDYGGTCRYNIWNLSKSL